MKRKKRKEKEIEEQKLACLEKRRQAEKVEKRKKEEARIIARKLAEEVRQKELEEEEAGRKSREQQRKQALEELQKIKRISQMSIVDIESDKSIDDKENNSSKQTESPDEILYFRASDESRRFSRYSAMRHKDDNESPRVREVESMIAANEKARLEALKTKRRIEDELAAEDQGPIYYGSASSVSRESKDLATEGSNNEIDDDLADEVEAIRLAADFSSRRLLAEQKQRRESTVTVPSGSRLRIRALLDKQSKQREEEERERNKKRESQDITKFLWAYR